MRTQLQAQSSTTGQTQPRKLGLRKETLRQLTNQELRLVAGGSTDLCTFTEPAPQYP